MALSYSILNCRLWLLLIIELIFFFVQAEDGIRYRDVTGVQTCALPISQFESDQDWYKKLKEYYA